MPGRCLSSQRKETVQRTAAVAAVEKGKATHPSERGVVGDAGGGLPGPSAGRSTNMLPMGVASSSSREAPKNMLSVEEDFVPFEYTESEGSVAEEQTDTGVIPRHIQRQFGCDRLVLFNAGDRDTPTVWSIMKNILTPEMYKGLVSIQKVFQKKTSSIRFDLYVKQEVSVGLKKCVYASTRKSYRKYNGPQEDIKSNHSLAASHGRLNKWRIDLFKNWRDRLEAPVQKIGCYKPWDVISIATFNINGFKNKKTELYNFLYKEQISICALQETLVKDHSYGIQLAGYNVFARPHKEGFRGQAILIHQALNAYEVGNKRDLIMHLKVNGIKSAKKPVHVIAVYLPSGTVHGRERRQCMKEIRKIHSEIKAKDPEAPCVILGDFNMSRNNLINHLKPMKTGLTVAGTRGSPLSRFPKSGPCKDLDHIAVNERMMNLIRPPRVRRAYEISDHRPVVTEFRYQPLTEHTPARQTRLDANELKANARSFVSDNRWAVLADMEVDNQEDLSLLTSKMANTLAEVTFDLGVKTTTSTGPPQLPKKVKKLLISKNKLAAKIAIKCTKQIVPTEGELARLASLQIEYKKAHKEWNKEMNRKEIKDLCDDIKSNQMKKVWNRLKRRITQVSTGNLANPVRNKAGQLCVTQEEILGAVVEHYDHLANGDPANSQNAEHWRNIDMGKMGAPKETLDELNNEISWRDVLMAIRRMKRGTAPGNDNLYVEELKELLNEECRLQVEKGRGVAQLDNIEFALEEKLLPKSPLTAFGKVLFKVIEKTWELERCPELWDEVTLCNLYKSGDPELMTNYRGISLISVGLKIVLSIMADRIYTELDNRKFFATTQSGFRRNEESVAQFITIAEVIRRRAMMRNKPTYAVFIDFKKAFDKVQHEALYKILDHVGVRGKMLQMVKALYQNAKIRVRSGGLLADSFGMARGNRQGCPMSPLLFNIYINYLLKETSAGGVEESIDGVCTGGQFADDLVALEETPARTQIFLNKLQSWCDKWGMEIGHTKSGVMMFGGTELQKEQYEATVFTAGGQDIPKVQEYKYLGIEMRPDMIDSRAPGASEELYAKKQAAKGMKKLWALRPLLKDKKLPLSIKVDLIKTFLVSAMSYGAEWIGYKGSNALQQQKVINKAMKIAMGVPSNSSLHESFTLSVELNIPQIEVVQNSQRTRLDEKVQGGQIKTYLWEMKDGPSAGRKWTWITGNERWRAKFGFKDKDLPLWYLKAQTYETHTRSNGYRWSVLDQIRDLRIGSNEGQQEMEEEERKLKLQELLTPQSPEDLEFQRECQVLMRHANKQHEQALKINQVKDATLLRRMKTNNSQAWNYYEMWNFGATRDFVRKGIAFPWLAKGLNWLVRIRTKAYPRVDQRWYRLSAEGKNPSFKKDECPICKGKILAGDEWCHLLTMCQSEKVTQLRNKHLNKSMDIIKGELTNSHIISEEGEDTGSPNAFGEVKLERAVAVMLLGGTVNDFFESEYHLGFGQLEELPKGLDTYGFVYTAKFLSEVMTLYLETLYEEELTEYTPVEEVLRLDRESPAPEDLDSLDPPEGWTDW